MAGEIQALFNKYQAEHLLYNRDAIVDLMLEDGVITAEVAKRIKSGESLFLLDCSLKNTKKINFLEQDFNITDALGANFSIKNKSNASKGEKYPLPYTFKMGKDADGENIIPLSQFELPSLQKTFSRELFDIKDENGVVFIIDKKTKKTVLEIEKEDDNYTIHQEYNGKKTVTEIYNYGRNKKETVYNKDGSYIEINPCEKTYYDKDGSVTLQIDYCNDGSVYKKEYSNGKVENLLVNELIKDITAKTKLGLPTTRDTLKQHIEQIQWYNAAEVLYTYYETTGRDLIADINEEIGLPRELRKELCEKIVERAKQDNIHRYEDEYFNYLVKVLDKDINSFSKANFGYYISMLREHPRVDKIIDCYKEITNGKDLLKEINKSDILKNNKNKELFDEFYVFRGDKGAQYLADLLDDDISGFGSGKLEQHIKFITPENVEQVLKNYTRPKILCIDVENLLKKFNVSEDEYEYVSTLEPLLTAIYSEWGLPEKKRYELMNHVLEQLRNFSYEKITYYDDIVQDLNNNMRDSIKRDIDLKRLDNRLLSGKERDIEWTESISQGRTGDCWLLAGIISILDKDNGNELIDKIAQDTGSGFTVNLKGVNKKINVSYNEIRAMTHLSSGDWRAIAIEIAVDKYMKDEAYKNNGRVDINGNNTDFLYKLILGNGKRCNPNDIKDINDFNNSKKVYSIGFNKIIGDKQKKYPNLGEDENGNKVDIVRSHAYSIKGSDNKYIYLINPWDSTSVIKVKWEDIKNLPNPRPDIYSADI